MPSKFVFNDDEGQRACFIVFLGTILRKHDLDPTIKIGDYIEKAIKKFEQALITQTDLSRDQRKDIADISQLYQTARKENQNIENQFKRYLTLIEKQIMANHADAKGYQYLVDLPERRRSKISGNKSAVFSKTGAEAQSQSNDSARDNCSLIK
ncbi:MAG: hypothetical protein V4496_02040 [Pseudomonadota bacterium]